MEGPPLGPRGENITLPDQVDPRGRKASSTRKIKPQTSNLNTASTDENRTGPPTAPTLAVRDATHQLGPTDLGARLTGTPSHYAPQAGIHPSHTDTCYRDPTTLSIHDAA